MDLRNTFSRQHDESHGISPTSRKTKENPGFSCRSAKNSSFFSAKELAGAALCPTSTPGTVQKHWGVDFKVIREYDIYTQYIFFMKRSYYKYVFFSRHSYLFIQKDVR
jgi:hypothetical protein